MEVLSTTTPSRPFLISTTAFISTSRVSKLKPQVAKGQMAQLIELSARRIKRVGDGGYQGAVGYP
jgi:hypothetical protein